MITKSVAIIGGDIPKKSKKRLYYGSVKFVRSNGSYILYNVPKSLALGVGCDVGVGVIYCMFDAVTETEMILSSEIWEKNELLNKLSNSLSEVQFISNVCVVDDVERRFGVRIEENPYGVDTEEVRHLVIESIDSKVSGKCQCERRKKIKNICSKIKQETL